MKLLSAGRAFKASRAPAVFPWFRSSMAVVLSFGMALSKAVRVALKERWEKMVRCETVMGRSEMGDLATGGDLVVAEAGAGAIVRDARAQRRSWETSIEILYLQSRWCSSWWCNGRL